MKRQNAIVAPLAGFQPGHFLFPVEGAAEVQKLIIARQSLAAADAEG